MARSTLVTLTDRSPRYKMAKNHSQRRYNGGTGSRNPSDLIMATESFKDISGSLCNLGGAVVV